jgi:hypothetical protein
MYVFCTTYAGPLSVQAWYSRSCPIISSSCYNNWFPQLFYFYDSVARTACLTVAAGTCLPISNSILVVACLARRCTATDAVSLFAASSLLSNGYIPHNIATRMSDYRRVFGLDIGFINHFNTQLVITLNYSAVDDLRTFQITVTHILVFLVGY